VAVDRKRLQDLSRSRLTDARALLGRKRWSGAYYLSGYVIVCALKACLLKHLGESDSVFGTQGYLKQLNDCWTHDLVKLVSLAGLTANLDTAKNANAAFRGYLGIVKDWKETSRYEIKTEVQARALYEAVTHKTDGVYRWIQSHW
jgi:hypothetical protein